MITAKKPESQNLDKADLKQSAAPIILGVKRSDVLGFEIRVKKGLLR